MKIIFLFHLPFFLFLFQTQDHVYVERDFQIIFAFGCFWLLGLVFNLCFVVFEFFCLRDLTKNLNPFSLNDFSSFRAEYIKSHSWECFSWEI